jgi:hypothetical protein
MIFPVSQGELDAAMRKIGGKAMIRKRLKNLMSYIRHLSCAAILSILTPSVERQAPRRRRRR